MDVEGPEGCMILFTNNAFHVGVTNYEKYGSDYLSHLRFFAYIVEDKYISIVNSVDKITKAIECDNNFSTCESMINDNIHYEGHIIRYLQSQCDIDNLNMGTVLLGELAKVSWVILKCAYEIKIGANNKIIFII